MTESRESAIWMLPTDSVYGPWPASGEIDILEAVNLGVPGAPNEMIIRYGSADPHRVAHTADWVPMHAGDRIMYDYGGGGGWGDPLDRDPQAVLDDVLDEYVSVEGATRDYGVVLTGSLADLTLAVDATATATLRAERRG